jgi:predicted RNA-binding protein with PIN domain
VSVQYIVDGYNFINHPLFSRSHKRLDNPRIALLDFIRNGSLGGSRRNKITVVFDGYPPVTDSRQNDTDIEVIFSQKEEADERIKRMVERSANRKRILVVSDDKQIKILVRSLGAGSLTIEEFVNPGAQEQARQKARDSDKAELNYTQMHQINQELKKLWLKE